MAKKRPASAIAPDVEPEVPKLKLLYFNIAAKGEPIRLLCAYAGLPLEDYRFASAEEFQNMKKEKILKFGQVPALVVDDTIQLVQTASILRFLARLKPSSGLYPAEDVTLAATIDALMDQVADMFMPITMWKYNERNSLPDEILTSDNKAKFLACIEADSLPKQLGFLQKFLEDSSTGWLAGTECPTIADFYWVCQLRMLTEWFKLDAPLKDFPQLTELIEKLMSLPEIQAYYGDGAVGA